MPAPYPNVTFFVEFEVSMSALRACFFCLHTIPTTRSWQLLANGLVLHEASGQT